MEQIFKFFKIIVGKLSFTFKLLDPLVSFLILCIKLSQMIKVTQIKDLCKHLIICIIYYYNVDIWFSMTSIECMCIKSGIKISSSFLPHNILLC